MIHSLPAVWRFGTSIEMRHHCPHNAENWLGIAERRELAAYRNPQRRSGWLLARMLAKSLLCETGLIDTEDFTAVEILSRDEAGRHVAPVVRVEGKKAPWSLSISHSAVAAIVALCETPGAAVGVDLLPCKPVSPAVVRMWFDDEEKHLAAEAENARRIWAIKEAAYKAVGSGDPFAPRQVCVRRTQRGQYTAVYRGVDLSERCRVETWQQGDHVVAVAVCLGVPARSPPVAAHWAEHCEALGSAGRRT